MTAQNDLFVGLPELAKRQLRDYDRHQPGSVFEEPGIDLSIAEAYGLQFEVARLREARGEAIVGYKIGCASPTIQAQLGITEPVFGHIFDTELHLSGVTLDFASYDGLSIEGEFAVRTSADGQSFASGFAVIELHNYVVRKPPLRAAELIANNAIHAGVVMPLDERRILPSAAELLDEPIAVLRNGEVMGSATAGALSGAPLSSIARLRQHLDNFGKRLLPGQIVLTGSPLPLYRAARGDRFEVRTEHLEKVVAFISDTMT